MATLGSSSLEVFPLVLGTNNFGWTSSPEESHRILEVFVASGGNFLDTADVYSAWVPGHRGGESESVICDWLAARGNRTDVLVATKGSAHPEFTGLRPETITAAAEQSLRRLRTAGFSLVDELVSIAAEIGAKPGTVALAWLRTRPTVTAPIAGASSVAQVEGLLASTTLELTEQHRQRLDRASDLFAASR
jgi:aryl-alcohol dehydrogenase-like predicted oxidoreductase